jgi:hypothetical protein
MPLGRSLRSGVVWALVASSGCGSAGIGGIVTGPEAEGQIALHNSSLREAWYAFTRLCGVAVWGEDELGPTVVLRPGQSAAWTERAGCYDLLVLSNPRVEPRFEARYQQQLVAADQQTAVAIADADWIPMVNHPGSPEATP